MTSEQTKTLMAVQKFRNDTDRHGREQGVGAWSLSSVESMFDVIEEIVRTSGDIEYKITPPVRVKKKWRW